MLTSQEDFEPEGIAAGSTLLNGQYVIQSRLQGGGFGMTFVATDSLERQVVIKECFPAHMCVRRKNVVLPRSQELQVQFSALKKQFIREARQMAKLVHPNIVAVHQVFEENNTAYMALDLVRGIDLVDIVEQQPERVTNEFVRRILDQSLTVIGFIHGKQLLHRDISPDNIMLDDKCHLTLIDFGAARGRDENGRTSIYAVKDGYSPPEMYQKGGRQGFNTDLYSLGATLHYVITGKAPPSCEDRQRSIEAGRKDPYRQLAGRGFQFDENILATIDRSLNMRREERFQTVDEWREMLGSAPAAATAARAVPAFSASLEAEIARMVKKTNSLLNDAGPVTKRKQTQKEAAELAQQKQAPRRTLVDIFGNEIEDIAAWQEQQEAELRERENGRIDIDPNKKQSSRSENNDPSGDGASRNGPKAGRLGNLLTKYVLRQSPSKLKTTDT